MSRLRLSRELILLTLLSAFAVAPLASPGYFFNAHDADHSVFFLVEFDAAIRDGALWPRWGPDHALGYGYPLWLVYAPLAYYVAEAFVLLGVGYTAAVKITWALATLAGGWGTYALLRHWFGRRPVGRAAALVGGLVYVYAPYHLLNLYVRAAFAEYAALAWFPWVILAFDRLVQADAAPNSPERWEGKAAGAALAYAGLLLTHTATILLFTPLLAAYLLFAILRRGVLTGRQAFDQPVQDAEDLQHTLTVLGLQSSAPRVRQELWRTVWRTALAGLLGIGVAAIFLLPMLLEQRYIVQSQWVQGTYGYRLHFVYPNQWLDPAWGYGYSDDPDGPNDGMSFQLGIVAVGLALTAAAAGLRRQAPRREITAFFLAVTAGALLMMLPAAQPVWDALAPLALVQFPWRLLGIASFGLAILAGAGVAAVLALEAVSPGETSAQQPVAYLVAVAVALASFFFTVPEYTDITPVEESPLSIIRFETEHPDMVGITAFSQAVPTDSPLVAQYWAGQPLQKAAILRGQGQVQTLRVGGASVTAQVDAATPVTVLFYTYHFPGWRATVDGQPVPHRPEPPYGLIALEVPAGQHLVTIRHGATPVRTAGALISAGSLAAVLGTVLRGRRRSRRSAVGSSAQ
ncbi:MAG: hypothetical protein RMN53_02780 [Anaerolineae bacterium]|nr:hypothetical protein [Anaerolineae bacterium]